MNFLKTHLKSGLGAAVGVAIYQSLISILVFGAIALVPIAISSLVTGVIFGAIFSVVHLRRTPTFLSSTLTGAGFVGFGVLLAVFAGTFVGISLVSGIALVVSTLLLGGGAYLGTRLFR